MKLSFVVDSAQARRELRKVQGDLRDVDKTGSKTGSSLQRHLGSGLKTAAVAGAAAIGGAAVAAYKMIGAGSDLNESINKTNVVFGKNAKAIQAWARGADQSLGISQVAAQDAVAQFAVFGRAAGLTGDKLTAFSKPLVRAAADMASFHNADPTQVLEDMQSGLAGETEPLRKYGILLNDAQLRQEALKLGLIDTVKNALTPQQKALAAQKLILDQLGPAAGDFARTSSGLANQQRILRARFENLTAHLGQKLLPVANKVAVWANNLLGFFTDIANAPSVDIAAKIAWSGVRDLSGQLWDKLAAAFMGDSKTFAAALDVRWTGITDVAGELWDSIGSALTGTTTTRRRYDVEAHRLVTFTRRDPGLLDDFMAALGSIFEGGTTTTRRYSTTLHKLITVERDDPSLAEQIATGLGKAIRAAARGITSSENRHAWNQSFGDLTDKTINPWLDRQAHAFNRWDDDISNQFRRWFRGSLRRVWNLGFSDITGAANRGLDILSHRFDVKLPPITRTVQGWGDNVHHAVTSKLGSIPGAVGRIWDSVLGGVNRKWRSISDTIGGWVRTALGPVNSVLDFLGLDKITFGSSRPTPHRNLPASAANRRPQGRAMGGWYSAKHGPAAIVAEAGHDEVVLTTDPKHRQRQLGLVTEYLDRIGVRKLARGGVLGSVTGAVSGAASTVAGAASGVAGAASSALGVLTDPVGWLKSHLPSMPHIAGAVGDLASGVLTHLRDKIIGYVKDKAGSLLSGILGGGRMGGAVGSTHAPGEPALTQSVLSWIRGGLGLAGVPATPLNILTIAARAWQESGWNPRAINLWDSNAAAGHPSIGIMQTIGPTFSSYAVAGHRNIYNPVDNIAAAVRYMLAGYGHLVGYTGVGYEKGTPSARPGWAWVGEKGPELVQFRGGEQVHNNAESRRITTGGKTTVNNFYFTNHFTRPTSPDEIRRVNREQARQVERRLVGVVA